MILGGEFEQAPRCCLFEIFWNLLSRGQEGDGQTGLCGLFGHGFESGRFIKMSEKQLSGRKDPEAFGASGHRFGSERGGKHQVRFDF